MLTKRWLLIATLFAVIATACSSAGAASPSPDAGATPSASPHATPKPTRDPGIAVASSFSEAYADIDSGTIHAVTTITLAGRQVKADLDATWNGNAGSSILRTNTDGVYATLKTVEVDAHRYEQTDNGPWIEDASGDSGSSDGDLMAELARLAAAVAPTGTSGEGDVVLYRLAPTAKAGLTPASLGLTDPTIGDFDSSVTFYARDDGTPARVDIHATWEQQVSERLESGLFEMTAEFRRLNTKPEIKRPDDVWVWFASATPKYSFAHPEVWLEEASPDADILFMLVENKPPFDMYVTGSKLGIVSNTAPADVTLSQATAMLKQSFEDEFGTTPTVAPIAIAGTTGSLVSGSGDEAVPLTLHEVVFIDGRTVYELFLVSDTTFGYTDLVTFKRLIETFRLG